MGALVKPPDTTACTSPLALQGFLPVWDIEKRRANIAPILTWTLDTLRTLGVTATSLTTLHHHLSPQQALEVSQSLTKRSLDPAFRLVMHRAVIEAIPEVPVERIWIQTHAHFRILGPEDRRAPVPIHTDFGFGHQLVERNLWFALTDAIGDGALHLLPLQASLTWMTRTGNLYGVLENVPDVAPVPTRSGEVLLFTPLHIHRSKTPNDGHSRVSIDVRIVPSSNTITDTTFSPLQVSP